MMFGASVRRCLCLALILRVGAEPADSSGRIYVYAQRDTPARSWLTIACDGKVVAELKRGCFFAVNVSPGRHVLEPQRGVPASIEVRESGEIYVRLDWHYELGQPPVPVLSIVQPEFAAGEIKFLSYADAKRPHSDTVPKTDPRPPVQPRLKTRDAP